MAREPSFGQANSKGISCPSAMNRDGTYDERIRSQGGLLYSVLLKNKNFKAIAFLKAASREASFFVVLRIFLRSLRVISLIPFVFILRRRPFWDRLVFSRLNAWGKDILKIAGVRLRVIDSEKVSKDKTYLFASNHLSLLDIPALCAAVPVRNRFIANKEVSSFFITNYLMKLNESILVDKAGMKAQAKALREIQQALLRGNSLIIFPESIMSRDGQIKRFKRGGLAAAVRANVDIMPIGIKGTGEACPPGAFSIKAGKEVQVIFGTEIDCKALGSDDKKNINQLVYNELKKLTESTYPTTEK
jgi:1-acyl-sn-glycerol-3-phosphate acyltransferase